MAGIEQHQGQAGPNGSSLIDHDPGGGSRNWLDTLPLVYGGEPGIALDPPEVLGKKRRS
jgi:hypothetical protein